MKRTIISLALLFLIHNNLFSWDNLHFYRASFFFGEPRFERDALTTLNVRLGGGASTTGRNSCSKNSCLLDIFGPQAISGLGKGLASKDLTNAQDLTLQLLEVEPAGNDFGLLSYSGKFKTAEIDLQFYQNIAKGFFFELYVPIRTLEINDLCCTDLTSDCAPCPNKESLTWKTFLNQYNDILARYCLCLEGVNHTGIGDVTALFGYAINYEDTEHVDFIDATIEAGVLFPTGRKSNPNIIFDLPQGYNGHYGFPANLSVAVGLYEWLTIGGHWMILPFRNSTQELRMQTSITQNGWIKLAKGCAKVNHGLIMQAGAYLKADHAIRNISLLLGYSYSVERKSTIYPLETNIFDPGIANSDTMLLGWNMHTIHLLADIDFLKEHSFLGSRIGLFGNIIVGGKRIFNTNIAGGTFGIDLVWCY